MSRARATVKLLTGAIAKYTVLHYGRYITLLLVQS